ncbi:hypothetical protein WA588_002140 [Blastocystis sp. NMH]
MVTCISELCESEVTALFKQSQKDPYFIIGLRTPQKVLLFGVERVGEDPESSYNDTFVRLPYGYSVVGMIHPTNEIETVCKSHSNECLILLSYDDYRACLCYTASDGSDVVLQSTSLLNDVLSNYMLIRVRYSLPVYIRPNDPENVVIVEKRIRQETMRFLCDSTTLLSGDMQESLQSVISTPGSPSLAPSFPSVHMLEFVDIVSLDRPVNPVHATDLEFHNLLFDSLFLPLRSASVASFLDAVTRQLCRQVVSALTLEPPHCFLVAPHLPVTLRRSLVRQPHYSSLPLPEGWRRDDADEEWRRAWHKHFALRENRPFFRDTNALFVPTPCEEPLRSVHLRLRPVDGACVVQGDYAYYHYLQQGEKDKGWGCAYRSLQTLFSFFTCSHYVECPVPSIAEIQKTLVHMGDKPSSFVGSREWIGSQEVSYVMSSLLDVDGKFIILDRGSDFLKHVRQLRNHFLLQGTPVMIGGGVLAFTCLGVQWNEEMKECKLLILDPHYTGADAWDEVLEKKHRMEGYYGVCCGWKSWREVFHDKDFYHLYLPTRPPKHNP